MRHPATIRFIILLILVIAGLIGLSQPNQPMMWMEASQQTRLNPTFSTSFLFQRRVFLKNQPTYQHVYWMDGSFKLGENVMMGGGIIYVGYYRHLDEYYKTVPEVRPFQFFTLHGQISGAKLSFRTMLEQRFTCRTAGDDIVPVKAFSSRYRFRLRGCVPVVQRMELELSNELLLNGLSHEKDRLDQYRMIARLRFSLSHWVLTGGYMHWVVKTEQGRALRPSLLVCLQHRLQQG